MNADRTGRSYGTKVTATGLPGQVSQDFRTKRHSRPSAPSGVFYAPTRPLWPAVEARGPDQGCRRGRRHDLAGLVDQLAGQERHVLAPADDPAPAGQPPRVG